MGNNIDFKLNKSGIIELFTSPEVNAWLQQVGNDVDGIADNMSDTGAEYGAREHNASRTAIVTDFPNNAEAAKDNYDNNTLLKALSASGLPKSKP